MRALTQAEQAAIFAYLAAGKPLRIQRRGDSAINIHTGKADRCPLPVATVTNTPDNLLSLRYLTFQPE